MLRAEDYQVVRKDIAGQPVSVTSYRIGDRFFCHIDNIDPGATIARAESGTCESAIELAMKKAEARLARSVR